MKTIIIFSVLLLIWSSSPAFVMGEDVMTDSVSDTQETVSDATVPTYPSENMVMEDDDNTPLATENTQSNMEEPSGMNEDDAS